MQGGGGDKKGGADLNWEAPQQSHHHFRIKKGGRCCWVGLGEDSYSGWYTFLQGYNNIYIIHLIERLANKL